MLIAVHVFGMPCDIQSINRICRKYKINVIEDAAEAIGSFYKKSHLGTNSSAGVISFNGNKTITTGNGAVILTKKKSLSDKIRHLSTQAKIKHKWEYNHDAVGYNYRLSNINAAIGCAQIEQIKKIILLKRKNFNSYEREFKNLKYVELLKEPKFSRSNFWLISLIIKKKEIKKNRLLAQLYKSGIYCRPVWKPLHTLKIFKKNMRDKCRNAEEIYKNTINLPSSPNISL